MIHVVIMAGGIGTRFWPSSRRRVPKQLLNIIDSQSMIQQTVNRVREFEEPENITIVTNKVQAALIRDHRDPCAHGIGVDAGGRIGPELHHQPVRARCAGVAE